MCIPQWLLYGIQLNGVFAYSLITTLLRVSQCLLYYFIACFLRDLTSQSSTKPTSDEIWYAVLLATVISNVLTSQFIFAIISKNKRECSVVLR